MSARSVFLGAVALSAVFFVVFLFLDPSRAGKGFPSNRDLKRAGSPQNAAKILEVWGEKGQRIARLNLSIDWLFIIVYSSMWISGAVYLQSRAQTKLDRLAILFASIGLAGAACDVIENACLYAILHGNRWSRASRLCAQVSPWAVAFFAIAAIDFAAAWLASRASIVRLSSSRWASCPLQRTDTHGQP